MMKAQAAFDQLDPQRWANTTVAERLALLQQIQHNLRTHAEALGRVDAKMKNDLIGEDVISLAEGMGTTVMPMAGTLLGIQRLYEALANSANGEMPKPLSSQKIADDLYEASSSLGSGATKTSNAKPCKSSQPVNSTAVRFVFDEVALDVSTDTDAFLTQATEFCNNKLLGSLGCMILIDNDTMKAHETRLNQAIAELNYGGIAVNDVPPNIWLNPYLTWGGCGETTENFVSGVGNFGNALNFENIKKSVIINDFSATSFELTHRQGVENLLENVSYFSIDQSWGGFMKLAWQMTLDGFKKKDF